MKPLLCVFTLIALLSACNLQSGSLVGVEEDSGSASTPSDAPASDDPADSSSGTEGGTDTGTGGCVNVDTLSTDTSDTSPGATEPETEPDTATQTETGTDTEPQTDTDTGTDADTQTEPDTQTDTDVPPACPSDMVLIPAGATAQITAAFCMDRYEASRSDATATSFGSVETIAISAKNRLPWYANPMNAAAFAQFSAACTAADKRLCTAEEWFASCGGPDHTTYATGNSFDVEICNNVATFCDDYCADHSIPPASCNTNISNCGYYCGTGSSYNVCWEITPTGTFINCTNGFGTFDINGNLWEIVTSSSAASGYQIRGGAINCAAPATRLQCTFAATWTDLFAGFRCCRDL